MKKYVSKALSVTTNIIIILLFICLLANAQSLLFGKKYNNLFGYSLLEIETASMKGTMEIGDWILIKVTDDVKLNDIITYESDGALITHRLIEIYGDQYIAKGDSNNTKDVPIKKDQIVGKVIKIMPKFGIIKKTILNEKVLFIVALILIISASFIDDNKSFFKKKKRLIKEALEEPKEEKEIIIKEIEIPEEVKKNITKISNVDLSKTKELSRTVLLSKVTVDIGENNYKKIVLDKDLTKTLTDFKINTKEVEETPKEEKILTEKEVSKINIEVEDNKFKDIYQQLKEKKAEEEAKEKENSSEESKELQTKEETKQEENEPTKEEPKTEENETTKEEPKAEENEPTKEELEKSLEEAAKTEIDKVKLEEISKEIDDFIEEQTTEPSKQETNTIGINNKNLIGKNIELKKHSLKEMVKAILDIENLEGRTSAITNKAIAKYIDIKYLNQCENSQIDKKDFNQLIAKQLDAFFNTLLEENKDINVINRVKEAFDIINQIDFEKSDVEKIVNNSNIENKEDVIKKLEAIQKDLDRIYKEFFDKILNERFELQTKRIAKKSTQEAMYATNLISKIQISKVFSDYIIEKTYQKDIITEDLREVQLKLISIKILNDMLSFDYNKKYIIGFPESLYSKPKKVTSILNNVDDSYSQNKIYYILDLETLKLYNEIISNLKKKGFKFIVEVPTNNLKLIDNIKKYLFIADYLLITGGTISKKEKNEYIPSYLHEKIIYIDKTIIEEVVVK